MRIKRNAYEIVTREILVCDGCKSTAQLEHVDVCPSCLQYLRDLGSRKGVIMATNGKFIMWIDDELMDVQTFDFAKHLLEKLIEKDTLGYKLNRMFGEVRR